MSATADIPPQTAKLFQLPGRFGVTRTNRGGAHGPYRSRPPTSVEVDRLVSCPRSSSYLGTDFWDQQATKNKELVSQICGSPSMANLRLGTRAGSHLFP